MVSLSPAPPHTREGTGEGTAHMGSPLWPGLDPPEATACWRTHGVEGEAGATVSTCENAFEQPPPRELARQVENSLLSWLPPVKGAGEGAASRVWVLATRVLASVLFCHHGSEVTWSRFHDLGPFLQSGPSGLASAHLLAHVTSITIHRSPTPPSPRLPGSETRAQL